MIVAVILILYFVFLIFYPANIGNDKIIQINEGADLSSIATLLKNNGLIKDKTVFVLYTMALGEDKNLKAGRYNFSGRVAMNDILYTLSGGLSEHNDIQVTIPEGMNVWEMDEIFSKSGLTASGVFAKLAINYEGKLFPDTYQFKKDADIQDIIAKMIDNFTSKAPIISKDQLIIASMLEKEASTKEDMETVAGVIKNRLAVPAGMLLQIDAAVAYGACLREFSRTNKLCDVTLVGLANEIKVDGSYNTYTRMGLPPEAISNPGLKAIRAALNPKETDYLFYLSTRDGSQIIYSKTSAEHLSNRKKYLGF